MSHAKRNIVSLQALAKATPAQRKFLLTAAHGGLVKAVCECANNTLSGNVKLTPRQKKNLRRHKEMLRMMAGRSKLENKKKKMVQSGGGFLAPLLAVAIPLLLQMLEKKE
jgi:hypothetical protein